MGGDSGEKKDDRQSRIETTHHSGASRRSSLHRLEPRREASIQSDTYSSFLYGGAESAGHHDISAMNEQTTEPSDMMLDDIFANIDPQTSYHDNDMDFLNFLDPSNEEDTQVIENVDMMGQSQSGIQHPFTTNIIEFAAPRMDTHPSIVIPANTTPEPSVQPQRITPLSLNRQTRPPVELSINSNYSSDLPTAASTIDPLSTTSPAMRRMQRTSINQRQLRVEPWSYDSTLDDIGTATFSDTTTKTEFPIQSKSSSPTVTIARRKDSDTPSIESPTTFLKPPKTSHNMIEKRYRLKLNDKILSLRNAVPALRSPPSGETTEDLDSGRGIPNKLNKGTVLTKATEYIQQLEREKRTLEQEVASLKEQLAVIKHERTSGQGFDWGGVAAATASIMTHHDENFLIVPSNGMISPKSCTSLMSPEAEGTLSDEMVEVEKVRPRKRDRRVRY